MSEYAFDRRRRLLTVSWDTGRGRVGRDVTAIPKNVDGERLARELTDFALALWQIYCLGELQSPSGQALVDSAVGSVERTAPTITHIFVVYESLPELGHRIGYILQTAGDAGLSERIVAECRAEVAAARSAESGILEDRAVQAARLWRLDPCQRQVDAASAIIDRTPIYAEGFETVEPTAACVAIIPYLEAMIRVVGAQMGFSLNEVIARGIFIDPTPLAAIETTDRFRAGESAMDIVTGLVRDATDVAFGETPSNLRALVAAATESLPDVSVDAGGLEHLCTLDPFRPALVLLQDLLHGLLRVSYLAELHDPSDQPVDERTEEDNEDTDAVRRMARSRRVGEGNEAFLLRFMAAIRSERRRLGD